MALSHWPYLTIECPNANDINDRYVTEETAVTCLLCLRRMAAGSILSEDSDSLDEYENPYLLGYCDGIEACFARILVHLDDDAHGFECTCDQCHLVHDVLASTLRRLRKGLGPDDWIRVHRN